MLIVHILLVVAHLRRDVLVPVATHVGAFLCVFLDALHLLDIDKLLRLVVHGHLTVDRSFLSLVAHHVVLVAAANLSVVLLLIADPRRHLVMVRLVNH